MSELLNALENHQSDLDSSIAIESIGQKQPPIQKSIDLTKEGNQALKERFNTLYNLYILKEQNSKQQVASMSFATEVFTMLPLLKKSNQARITSSPSKGNQELIDDIISKEIKDIDYSALIDSCKQIEYAYNEIKDEAYRYINSLDIANKNIHNNMRQLEKKPPTLITDYKGERVAKSALHSNIYELINMIPETVDKTNIHEVLYMDFKDNSDILKVNDGIELADAYDRYKNFYSNICSALHTVENFCRDIDSLQTQSVDRLSAAARVSERLDLIVDQVKFIKDAIEYLKNPNAVDGLERLTAILVAGI